MSCRHPSILISAALASMALYAPALADDGAMAPAADAALREAREILATEMFGHYDVVRLDLVGVEPLEDQEQRSLATVILAFSTRRNASRHESLNPAMFEPGSPMCADWLYLHCGVPAGHVFDGKLRLLLAGDRAGVWRVVPPHGRSRSRYSLDGYLLLDGRAKEGYVVFPRQDAR